jgi:ParB/RepB/Spo0J family partition protein
MTLITRDLVSAERLLRVLDQGGWTSMTELAEMSGRVRNHMARDLGVLEQQGLIVTNPDTDAGIPYLLTDAARNGIKALDRANGEGEDETATPAGHVALRFDEIEFDPDNARTDTGLEQESIDEFADGIAERGILQKPRVRMTSDGRWRLVMGERRVRAWGRLIERGVWPADHREILSIHEGGDADVLEAGLVENLHRADLNNLEIAVGIRTLHERHHRTVQQLAKVADRTDRYIQIALKVTHPKTGASAEDKARYVESERAYHAAKARNETIKRTFTWEDLRDTVTVPKYVTALEKRDRLTLLIAELALKSFNDVNALHQTNDGEFVGAGRMTGLTRISTPPGGGHWSSAETLYLVNDKRNPIGDTQAAVTPLAEAWIREQLGPVEHGDLGEALLAWVTELRLEVLGGFGEQLRKEGDTFGTTFLKPPPPRPADPPPVAPPAPEPVVPEHLVGLQVRPDDRAPPRDDFAAAIREVNTTPQEVPASLTSDAARDAAPETGAAPANPQPAARNLTDAEFLALTEVIHKTTKEGVEARGGQMRGAKVASDFSSCRHAVVANGLTIKRMIMFIQASSGTGFLCVPTQAAWDLIQQVDDETLEGAQHEGLAREQLIAHEASGQRYYTSWLTVPAAVRAEPEAFDPAPLPDITERVASQPTDEDELEDESAAVFLAKTFNYVARAFRPDDAIGTEVAALTEDAAREIGEGLAASGRYDEVAVVDRSGRLIKHWGRG